MPFPRQIFLTRCEEDHQSCDGAGELPDSASHETKDVIKDRRVSGPLRAARPGV